MMRQKGFVPALLVLIILAISVGIIRVTYYLSKGNIGLFQKQPSSISASPPSSLPTPSPSVQTSPVTPTSLAPSISITEADNGKTFHAAIGAVITISLQAANGMQNWSVETTDRAILSLIANPAATAARGVTLKSFKAVGKGTAVITASDRPICNPGQICPQFIQGWRVTVIVDQ